MSLTLLNMVFIELASVRPGLVLTRPTDLAATVDSTDLHRHHDFEVMTFDLIKHLYTLSHTPESIVISCCMIHACIIYMM